MKIDVLTLFPSMVEGLCDESIVARAQQKGRVSVRTINFRYFGTHPDGRIDDVPYGGGGGMVIQAQPVFDAVAYAVASADVRHPPARAHVTTTTRRIVLLCPQGERFTQQHAHALRETEHLIFLAGHYEGFDERIRQHLVTDVYSLGDFVMTGGEIAACAMVDAIVRLLPDVLGNAQSANEDSFAHGRLEYPQYTRPAQFRGMAVPEVLLTGHHARIQLWRQQQSLLRTWRWRPDLFAGVSLSPQEQQWIAQCIADGVSLPATHPSSTNGTSQK